MVRHGHDNDAHDAAFEAEHWLAWLFSAGALLLGLFGLLRAFGIIGSANTTAAGQVTSVSPGGLPDTLWDGGMLLLAALAASLLAFALHRNDHHRMRDLDHVPEREAGLWQAEHTLAYVMAAATVVFAVLGLLTGYNKVGGHRWQPDGIPWLLAAIGTGLLTNMLHAVRHHQMEYAVDRGYRTVERPVVAVADASSSDFVQEPMAGYRPEGPVPMDVPRGTVETPERTQR